MLCCPIFNYEDHFATALVPLEKKESLVLHIGDPPPLGGYYLVPFWNHVNNGFEAHFYTTQTE